MGLVYLFLFFQWLYLYFLTILSTAIVSISSCYIREKLYLLLPTIPSGRFHCWEHLGFYFQMVILCIFKISSTSSYLNLTVTFSVLFDHYSFLYTFSWFWYLFYWIILSYFFFSKVFVGGKIPKSLKIQSLYLSPNLKVSLTDIESGFKITLAFFSSFWAMHGKFNPHMFMSNSSSYCWNSLGFFFLMIWCSTMMVRIVSVLELVLWHRVGPFNLLNYVFFQPWVNFNYFDISIHSSLPELFSMFLSLFLKSLLSLLY